VKILRVFINVDMRNGHNGLTALAKEHKTNVGKLAPGEFVIFINAARTKLKAYGTNEVLSYVRQDKRISLDAIRYLPMAFKAKQKFDYDSALSMAVNDALAKGQRKSLEVF